MRYNLRTLFILTTVTALWTWIVFYGPMTGGPPTSDTEVAIRVVVWSLWFISYAYAVRRIVKIARQAREATEEIRRRAQP